MFEIQDAAKVITESIDKEAKVIFGTIRDDKLKKNEIRITVIAAGFPETSKADMRPRTNTQKIMDEVIAPPKDEKRRIFNTLSRRTDRLADRADAKRGRPRDAKGKKIVEEKKARQRRR